MHKEDILSLDSRRRIYDVVKANPGTHLREIARKLDLPLGTALYHLDYLTANELLVVRRDGRYKRFFVKHMLGRREKDYVSAFHHDVPRKIATVLLAKGKMTQRELCEEVGVSRSTLSFHVNNLVDKGILECENRWPENLYHVSDPEVAAKILVLYRSSFTDETGGRFAELVATIRTGRYYRGHPEGALEGGPGQGDHKPRLSTASP